MSEIKQRPVRDSNPNEKTRLIKINNEIDYQTNRKRPILDSKPNETKTDSSPKETTRQLDNYEIENEIGLDINTNNTDETSMQPLQVCMNSDTKKSVINKWPPPF